MEDNRCHVQEASEAPFFVFRLLSKLEPEDNADLGREMQREKKEENVINIVTWLHQETTLQSRGEKETGADRLQDLPYCRKTDQHFPMMPV